MIRSDGGALATAEDLAPGDERREDDVGHSGSPARRRRNSPWLIRRTRPSLRIRPRRKLRWPVSRLSSPRNRPGPWVAMIVSLWSVVDVDDVGLTVEDHDQVVVALAFDEQRFSSRDRVLVAIGRQPSELRRCQRREGRRVGSHDADLIAGTTILSPALQRPWQQQPGTARSSPSPTTRWSSRTTTTSRSTSVVDGVLVPSDHTSVCPWKGTASYYSLEVDGERNPDAAWYYPAPKEAAAEITGRVAFWRGVVVTA